MRLGAGAGPRGPAGSAPFPPAGRSRGCRCSTTGCSCWSERPVARWRHGRCPDSRAPAVAHGWPTGDGAQADPWPRAQRPGRVRFLRRVGLPDTEGLPDDPSWVTWRAPQPCPGLSHGLVARHGLRGADPGAEPAGPVRDPVRPAHRHPAGGPSPGTGLRFWHDLARDGRTRRRSTAATTRRANAPSAGGARGAVRGGRCAVRRRVRPGRSRSGGAGRPVPPR